VTEFGLPEPTFFDSAFVHLLTTSTLNRLRILYSMTALPQGDLPNDAGILRTAARHNQASVGVYASVLQGGIVRRGDPVRLE
jgi:hypothetical protein